MLTESVRKITPDHLQRAAYLYSRQSTLRQVMENTESTQRQYALRERALALGWPAEHIRVIDSDLGKSGAERDRAGFQLLVTDVSLGRAGIVMGLEVSRLARNSMDWHRLLELCALSETLILDEDGLYDPAHFNDRLLLGMKGTLSEAELHVLRARLQGGIRNKARRGELRMALPVGFIYQGAGQAVLDPDQQVQGAVQLVFKTFARTGSASATVKWFRQRDLLFPRRPRHGPHQGELLWGELSHSRVLHLLHNPRYAGAFVFGRTRTRKTLEGRTTIRLLPREQWDVVRPESHAGYISWETFEANQHQLRENAKAHSVERQSPPREGPALLQGIVLCGLCGDRMTVRYKTISGKLSPYYVCQLRGIRTAEPICQHVPGAALDAAVGHLLLETMTPMELDVALAVEQEVQARMEEANVLRYQHVERSRYEVDLARRRYLKVDPDNRLVAASLEADWHEKLRALQNAQETYDQHRQSDQRVLEESQKADIRSLAGDFPKLWRDAKVSHRDRKRLVRLLLEDVTLIKGQQLSAQVRFKGGAHRTLKLTRPRSAWQLRQTSTPVIEQIDRLLDSHTDGAIARELQAQGFASGTGSPFTPRIVAKLRRAYGLKSRYDRLREAGMLTVREVADQMGVSVCTTKIWRQIGRLQAHLLNDKGEYLYEPLGEYPPVKQPGKRLTRQSDVTTF